MTSAARKQRTMENIIAKRGFAIVASVGVRGRTTSRRRRRHFVGALLRPGVHVPAELVATALGAKPEAARPYVDAIADRALDDDIWLIAGAHALRQIGGERADRDGNDALDGQLGSPSIASCAR